MFCKNCGAPVDDGDLFCLRCGTPVSEEAAPVAAPVAEPVELPVDAPELTPDATPESPAAPKKPLNKKLLIGIASAVVAVLVLVIVLIATRGTHIDQSSWKSSLDSYVRAIKNKDADGVISLLPIDYFCGKNRVTERQVHDELEQFFRLYSSYIDFGSISYSVTDVYEVDSGLLAQLNRDYSAYTASSKAPITAAMTVRISTVYPLKTGQAQSVSSTLRLLLINGKWYVFNLDGGF
jgi:uncharacterized Zn finger protein (UPF0148 family)